MTKLKIALAATLAVTSIAAVAVPIEASARPHDRDRYDRHDGHDRYDRGDRRHGRHKVRVCRNVRYHGHWERRCHWEWRRW